MKGKRKQEEDHVFFSPLHSASIPPAPAKNSNYRKKSVFKAKKSWGRSVEFQNSMRDPRTSVATLSRQMPESNPEKLKEDLVNLQHGYVTLLREMKKRMPDLPNISIKLKDVTHEVKVIPETEAPKNVLHAAYNLFKWLYPPVWWVNLRSWWQKTGYRRFRPLDKCSATFQPGTMTMVISPPGHGKSSLLKAMAGRLSSSELSGTVHYSGMRREELPLSLEKLVGYVDQKDIHHSNLTVRETLEFACDSSLVQQEGIDEPLIQEILRKRVDTMIKLLSLEDCENTRIGDQTSRGISGGEKRRLSIGEVLVTRARVLLLDEITNGLDSTVAYKLLQLIGTWCYTMHGTVVASILTPSPELFELFDQFVLMIHGRILYQGDRPGVIEFFRSYGLEKQNCQDEASFVMEALSQLDQKLNGYKTPERNDIETWQSSRISNTTAPTVGFVVQGACESPASSIKTMLEDEYIAAQYGREYAQTFLGHTYLCLRRQAKLLFRNLPFLGFRFFQATFLGFLVGLSFLDLKKTDFQLKVGILPHGATTLGFVSMSEIPVVYSERPIVQKQLQAKMYPVVAYTIALIVAELPTAAIEAVLIGTPLYWLPEFSEEAGRFFFFLLIYFLAKITIGMFFKAITIGSSTSNSAQSQGSALVGILLPLGGFLVTRSNIWIGMRWLYWVSPFSWITNSLQHNELGDPYFSRSPAGTSQSLRDIGLESFDIPTDSIFKWAGVVVLLGYLFIASVSMSALLIGRYFDPNIGSNRKTSKESDATSSAHTLLSKVKVEPYTLVLEDIEYKIGEKKVLQGVSAVAEPGTLVCVMGPSGAGKSTLLDAIISRKTVGSVSGKVLLNGQSTSLNFLRRVSSYVEQQDSHLPYLTVFESLLYAAELRLDPSLPREEYVEKILDMIELRPLKHKLVGDPSENSQALSPSERKRLSIGVELTSNPSILLLDEPTTGLNFRDGMKVMKVIRQIAATGRTVLCSIHQPSEEVFWLFDVALILQSGGYQVYFGDVGKSVKYFKDMGVDGPKTGINPADWLMDTVSVAQDIWQLNLSAQYLDSELHQRVERQIEDWIEKGQLAESQDDSPYRRSWTAQLSILLRRSYTSYFRNVSYNWGRIFITAVFSFIMGIFFLNTGESVDDIAGVRSVASILFVPLSAAIILNTPQSLEHMASEKPIYYRETTSHMYTATSYCISQTLAELPYCAIISVTTITPVYFMAAMNNSATDFFHTILISILLDLSATHLGFFLSAAILNQTVAHILGSLLVTLQILFGGIFIPKPSAINFLQWVYYLNPLAYSVNVAASLQLFCESSACPQLPVLDDEQQGEQLIGRYEYASDVFDFDHSRRWEFTVYIFLIVIALGVFSFLGLKFRKQVQR